MKRGLIFTSLIINERVQSAILDGQRRTLKVEGTSGPGTRYIQLEQLESASS
jgi:hypothetical protein